jgi:hypothetical protein
MTYPMPTGWVPSGTPAYNSSGFDLASEVENYRTQQGMAGQEPISEYGGDPLEYLTNLYFSGQTALADQWAQQAGIDRTEFLNNVTRVNQESQASRGSNIFGAIGELTRVGRGEVTGALDFARDAALLGAIGYGTAQLGGTSGGTGTATVSASDAAAGSVAAPAASGVDVGALISGGMGPQAVLGGGGAAAGGAILNNLGPIIAGASSLIGGRMASNSADRAVDAMSDANREALDFQRESRDIGLGLIEPERQAANTAMARMLQMQGLPIPASLQAELDRSGVALGDFNLSDTPGYQSRLSESMRALETSAFALGGGMSGGFAQRALRYAQDYASNEYHNIYNQLATLTGRNTSTAGADIALNFGGNAANIAMNTGMARASGYVAQGNAWQNALDQVAQLPWEQWFPRQRRSALAYGG